ncbi:TetR/AcrR family transcriptional regulator [Actinoplanes friuliensis]|uniref:TetR-type regulator n=1 Tax=Actinoplanes friuliensis DSM 7358 TaxID=1246995 RepID=U5WCN7_9ACTN|nr:TetR/AcrR family transcriptional regulator [Actinoplanes friuliensis]AGZ45686.1 TetR-type regulator [Actinoplanes friuliensis DSM 7358]
MAPTTSTAALRADSARVRERMVAAAREAFVSGDTDLPMNAIAKAAGVGVGTMYRHFPTRQALLESMAAESFEALVTQARVAAAEPDIATGLAGLLRAALQCQLRDPSLAAVLATPTYACEETLELSRELGGASMELLERARVAGVIRPDVTADDMRRLMCGVRHAVVSGDDDGTVADRYLTIMIAGLKP